MLTPCRVADGSVFHHRAHGLLADGGIPFVLDLQTADCRTQWCRMSHRHVNNIWIWIPVRCTFVIFSIPATLGPGTRWMGLGEGESEALRQKLITLLTNE
jgi:hypothetical protein